ncbi:zinc finger and BTB domain-containing protein 22 [Girardinichthys multiradiatus]|uniref:zinc finger and BTB domain-containing protein 22 n=1 Tax=Girardinichthys multiradiatus TaxID=208333 RepID=UPI001FAC2C25|nr:zinc finger and BTB domain-containing protein 22 [Girardinichthys multiradiatus]
MDPTCCDAVAPPGLTVQVCFPGVRAAVLDNLNQQREEGRLCDLSIQVQGQVFRAHRCVLAASSPYFHDQVLLKNVTTVSLPSVMDPVAFESVLSSAYTGQLSIIHDDIVNYVTVASFLQMWHIVDKCTEILKRPRPSGEVAGAPPGSASRQQSPSSTECLYAEREARRRERKPDALPPLATWRRPQQVMRWSRLRPSSQQHLADSQLDGYVERDPSSCQGEWISSSPKTGPPSHDGPGQTSRHHVGVPAVEAMKQKLRFQQRGAPQSRDGNEAQDRRRNIRRETEADEGVGDGEVETKEGFTQMDQRVSDDGEDAVGAAGRQIVEVMKEKVPSSHFHNGPDVGGPSCPASGKLQFPSGSWFLQEQIRQGGEDEDEDDNVDFECFGSYDEIEDGTGQVSQRPLLSPVFSMGTSEVNWPSTSGGQGGALTPSSSSAAFPPPPSPPTPSSSSSSVSISGAAYTGKVHFCHCGKAYTLKSMRDRHVKMQHLNLRPFGCPVCTKSFKMKHHLTKHLKTHGGLRPYECSLCGKKVIWRDSFLRHQARCERLASSSNNTNAVDLEDGYGFGFDEGEAFVPTGQVKVEEGEFHRDLDDGMGGLLGNVSEMELGAQPQNLDSVSHVFKEEAAERLSES